MKLGNIFWCLLCPLLVNRYDNRCLPGRLKRSGADLNTSTGTLSGPGARPPALVLVASLTSLRVIPTFSDPPSPPDLHVDLTTSSVFSLKISVKCATQLSQETR